MKILSFVLLALVALVCFYILTDQKQEPPVHLNFIITEAGLPDSFDPLNADQTHNLNAMRMLYATPLEIGRDNFLKSALLESFTYDEASHTATFNVKQGLKYSNGETISAEDVALSIARIAYFRPEFPVIKQIRGVKSWAASKKGLMHFPAGIAVKDRSVTLTFEHAPGNPLFRFALELFSVIPSSCIDLSTGKMNCEVPPFSGYFSLASREDRTWLFQRREDMPGPDPIQYKQITFSYSTFKDACSTPIPEGTIVSGVEIDLVGLECPHIGAEQVHWLPSSRFGVLRFNPTLPPFDKKENRRAFAETVRQVMREQNPQLIIERGLLPKLLPGFIDSSELDFADPVTELSGKTISLPPGRLFGLSLVNAAAITAAERLGMKSSVPELPSSQMVNAFLEGKINTVAGASGFWAQDPIGDASMWFTKNLHKTMTFVWKDQRVYELLKDLEAETDSSRIPEKMRALNRHVAEESLIAPILHYRRLYITNRKTKDLHLPQAATSPAPWHLRLEN